MLLPFQGVNGGVASYPGCRSLWSLALGWEMLPFQGANGGVECHLLLSYNPCRYTRYVETRFRRISCISRNVYIRHTRTFYFLNTNFSNCTNAFHKEILRDPRDTWRLVSGVSRVSHVFFYNQQMALM